QPAISAAVYIKNFSSFPAYPYNTTAYKQGGAFVGCGPTTGTMILAYFHHVENMSSSSGLLTSPVTGVNEGLNTAWVLHGSQYMNTAANGFGSVYNIEPGLENYATSKGHKVKAVIHASPTYSNPNSSEASWLNDYGPFGDAWTNDGIFWRKNGNIWDIDANDFCTFVDGKLSQGIAIFLTIDTNNDKSGDHWVALVGYDRSTSKFAFYDTYSTTVKWASIKYCNGPGAPFTNSISMLRTVTYQGSTTPQLPPPLKLLALNYYNHAIPLAWNQPAGSAKILAISKKSTLYQPIEMEIDFNITPEDLPGSLLGMDDPFSMNETNSAMAPLGYNVYRSTSATGSFSKIASNITRQYYRDESVTNGQTYYYKVTAIYSGGESDFSNTANASATSNGYTINAGWASSPPSMNGVINASEWAQATKTNIIYPGSSEIVTLYLMNDNSKLYIAMDDIRDTELNHLDQFAIFFDENKNREWPSSSPSGEGNFWIAWDSTANSTFSLFGPRAGYWPDHLIWEYRITPPGASYNMSISSGHVQYEGTFDLASSPLNASPGSTIGFLVFTYDKDPMDFNSLWPEQVERLKAITPDIQYWGQGPFSFGDLKLSSGQSFPDISSNPTTWNFGLVPFANYSDKTFVIKNEGATNLNVTATSLSGPNAAEFNIQSGGGAFTLTSGATRNLVVRFTPTSEGNKSATISISSNDPDENPLLISLNGSSIVPDIAVDPTTWNFGSVTTGSFSDKTFIISNTGSANLGVTATTLTGTNASEFIIQSGGGAFTLSPGGSRNIIIRFNPTSAGNKSAALRISSNDPDENPLLVNLTGQGSAPSVPDISINPTTWNFGSVTQGNFSDKTFIIKNDGTANLGVTAITLSGTNAAEFAIQSGGGTFSLSPGGTRNLIIRFNPTSAGNKSASLRISSNDPDENPLLVNLTGQGTAPSVPDISINPTIWNFGAVTSGSYSDKTFIIKNDGTANLGVTVITISGTNAAEFAIQSGGGAFTLSPGGTRNLIIRFNPTSTGNKSATLSISSNDPDENPLQVTLTGSSQSTTTIPIFPEASSLQTAGNEFWVNINVGTSSKPVTDLFGLSFVLNFTNTNYINCLSAEAAAFFGSDIIFFPTLDDPNGKVSIGMSRKTGQGGVSGLGTVAKIKFTSEISTPNNLNVQFTISNVVANNSAGEPLTLTPEALTITIQSGVIVWPGDTNNSGRVDQADILPLGLHWERTGPARQNASSFWSGQLAQFWSPQAATFADANGDGKINQADVLPVGLNWNKTHTNLLAKNAFIPAQITKRQSAGSLSILISGNSNPDQDFYIDIIAENVTNLLGLSYELIYSPTIVIDPISVETGSANLMGTDLIFFPMINKNAGIDSGKVSIGISRKFNQGEVSGTGLITRILARMSPNAVINSSSTLLSLCNIQANDASGNPLPMSATPFNLITNVHAKPTSLPTEFALLGNYPNPFNPGTTIEYQLSQPSEVELIIYDVQGHLIRRLIKASIPAGVHQVAWNGLDENGQLVATGIYYYRIVVRTNEQGSKTYTDVRKMILMK
ncbi:choice-of-anchor D domain-containing protein, partial [candidate division KSB1 bacterium]|nr:choice-of-anchor D domain-containing protein [candidate division KSB1 bacterium]